MYKEEVKKLKNGRWRVKIYDDNDDVFTNMITTQDKTETSLALLRAELNMMKSLFNYLDEIDRDKSDMDAINDLKDLIRAVKRVLKRIKEEDKI